MPRRGVSSKQRRSCVGHSTSTFTIIQKFSIGRVPCVMPSVLRLQISLVSLPFSLAPRIEVLGVVLSARSFQHLQRAVSRRTLLLFGSESLNFGVQMYIGTNSWYQDNFLFSFLRIQLSAKVVLRARGVVGYHARLAHLRRVCERGPVQSRTCPFFYIFVWL